MIRDARAGQASAQLALGKRYLHGEGTFAKNLMTALYWLDRAAHQEKKDAWILIGAHIPLEIALRSPSPLQLLDWYERAFDEGIMQAGIVLAKLVLEHDDGNLGDSMRRKARCALEQAAMANIPEAQWWLAQHIEAPGATTPNASVTETSAQDSVHQVTQQPPLEWLRRAAENGIAQAKRSLAEIAWGTEDKSTFLRWALPIAEDIMAGLRGAAQGHQSSRDDVVLLRRCAQALFVSGDYDPDQVEQYWTQAAQAGDADAQLWLGLWWAKMDVNGERVTHIPRRAKYRRAIQLLTAAAEQGKSDAWYVIAKIYQGAGFMHRSAAESQHFLVKAAEAGHLAAQLELGKKAWHARHEDPSNDIRAAYWLQRAAAQGNSFATVLLEKIVCYPVAAPWAQDALRRLGANVDPLLRARVELAALFGLTRAEALLLDMHDADRPHCLLVDISAERSRSKRRLILIRTGEQRQQLSRIIRLFEHVDCSPNGPEGNHRKRFYRLNAALAQSGFKELSAENAA